jgi:hypothetical protein
VRKSPTFDRTVPLTELAEAWGWSAEHIRKLCRDKEIPYLLIRGHYYFEESVVERWKAERRQEEERRAAHVPDIPEPRPQSRIEELVRLGINPVDEFPWD